MSLFDAKPQVVQKFSRTSLWHSCGLREEEYRELFFNGCRLSVGEDEQNSGEGW